VNNPIIAPVGAVFVHEGVTVPIVTDVKIIASDISDNFFTRAPP